LGHPEVVRKTGLPEPAAKWLTFAPPHWYIFPPPFDSRDFGFDFTATEITNEINRRKRLG